MTIWLTVDDVQRINERFVGPDMLRDCIEEAAAGLVVIGRRAIAPGPGAGRFFSDPESADAAPAPRLVANRATVVGCPA